MSICLKMTFIKCKSSPQTGRKYLQNNNLTKNCVCLEYLNNFYMPVTTTTKITIKNEQKNKTPYRRKYKNGQ